MGDQPKNHSLYAKFLERILLMKFSKLSNKKNFKNVSDNELVRRIVENGERDLFNELYERYASIVYYKAYSFTKDNDAAKDLTHDIMVKIFTKLSKFRGESKFSLWVNTITYNACVDYTKRKKKMFISEHSDEILEHEEYDDTGIEEKELKEIQLQQLEHLLEVISVEDKMLLLMYYKDGLPVKEMAKVLKIGVSAVKMRLQRARHRLAKQFEILNKKGGEDGRKI